MKGLVKAAIILGLAKITACVVLGGIRMLEAGHPWLAALCFLGVLIVGAQ